jgi:L-lactate dehydrogenase (cytochrome)
VVSLGGLFEMLAWTATQVDPSVTWKDLDWIRQFWRGPLILKGVLSVSDAREAVACGAQAIVVSNHGGRQLDSAPASLAALPAIADAVGSDCEVLMDGGVRSGQDVAKALALGARACLVGRAWVYGVAARGERGVRAVIETLKQELRVTMALLGVPRIAEIDRRVLEA